MESIKILFGLLTLILAWVFLFRTGIIFRLNQWMRDNIFSDRLVLFAGRRLAVLLLILGGLALFSGVDDVVRQKKIKPKIAAEMLKLARADLADRNFKRVVNRCKELVRSNPDDMKAWELLSVAWWALGEKGQSKKAAQAWVRLNKGQFPIQKTLKTILNSEEKKKK